MTFLWPDNCRRGTDANVDELILHRLGHIARELHGLQRKVESMSVEQDAIDAAVTALGIDQQALADAAQRIEDEIAALQAQGVDVTGLQAAVAATDAAVGNVVSIVPPPA